MNTKLFLLWRKTDHSRKGHSNPKGTLASAFSDISKLQFEKKKMPSPVCILTLFGIMVA